MTTRAVAIVFTSMAVLLISGCATAPDYNSTFTDTAVDLGYSCNPTVPPRDTIEEIVSCDSDGNKITLVVFENADAFRDGESLFRTESGTAETGDRWLVVGDNESDVTTLSDALR